MIDAHYTRTVNVLRMADGSNDTETYASHLESVACHIQPLEDAFAEDITGNFGKDFLMFCDRADILEGDRIVDAERESLIYKVVSREAYAFRGRAKQMELRIRRSLP